MRCQGSTTSKHPTRPQRQRHVPFRLLVASVGILVASVGLLVASVGLRVASVGLLVVSVGLRVVSVGLPVVSPMHVRRLEALASAPHVGHLEGLASRQRLQRRRSRVAVVVRPAVAAGCL